MEEKAHPVANIGVQGHASLEHYCGGNTVGEMHAGPATLPSRDDRRLR